MSSNPTENPRIPQKTRILAALLEAPATTSEVSAVTGLPMKHCCAIMRILWQIGVLRREPFRLPGRRSGFLYSIKEAT